MADPHAKTDSPPPPTSQTPLLNSGQNHNHREERAPRREENDDLSRTLERLDKFLAFLGFNQSCLLRLVLSWAAFLLIGVLLPVLVLQFSGFPGTEKYQIRDFELGIVASQACLAAVSLLCVSHNIRKHGIRRFLFVDRHTGYMLRLKEDYIKQISVRAFCFLVCLFVNYDVRFRCFCWNGKICCLCRYFRNVMFN